MFHFQNHMVFYFSKIHIWRWWVHFNSFRFYFNHFSLFFYFTFCNTYSKCGALEQQAAVETSKVDYSIGMNSQFIRIKKIKSPASFPWELHFLSPICTCLCREVLTIKCLMSLHMETNVYLEQTSFDLVYL